MGISVVQQDPFLFDHLSVAENIFVNNLPIKSDLFKTINKAQRFEEIVKLSDQITVLRDGLVIGSVEANSADFQALVQMMPGNAYTIDTRSFG